jgi:hypothetical protein
MQIIGVEMSPLKIKKNARLYLRVLLSDYRMSILSITAMNNAVQVIRVALLSDIRNVVSYTKKGGSTWLPV